MGENMHYFVNGRMATAKDVDDDTFEDSSFDWTAMLGDKLYTANGMVDTNSLLASKKLVALFFGGAWCPWCRAFTPMIEGIAKQVKAADPDDTEIVYIPVDVDMAAFETYMKDKPWVAMDYDRSQGNNGAPPQGFVRKKVRTEQNKPAGVLQDKYEIGGLPKVVVLSGKTGEVVYKDFVKDLGNTAADGMEFTADSPPSWLDALEAANRSNL
mmetsp:Transcript_54366/g.116092  ORF Transcript_54366/g.116092 Transcript_54366/m.116092 type:complete len:212 (-) Transcript_54366:156-791(-)|eukprot:CAMPEP_0206470238 /NCGR_PEP_ID=MMETSP0324_2-20121206/30802_1 /ASSEMBLY_ACC=CAM_ASM_000836 /TAXON_ID=2866 /ORGANISM="Crypthecodinium cohnii, Strain Seligo" /LENGTH=211 /DNA_ID=CAMNT_0053944241 /DNA_START=72 /DNA_END=707 /DNA_ORIENTATION=-